MEGPFKHIRNKWQKTPLERIVHDIEEISGQIIIEEEKLNTLNESGAKNIQKFKVDDLKNTMKTLQTEKEKREKRVLKLNERRKKLINRVINIRNEQNKTYLVTKLNKKNQKFH